MRRTERDGKGEKERMRERKKNETSLPFSKLSKTSLALGKRVWVMQSQARET